ncbi:MAG: hypothetical protein U0236_18210 [Nitrospira sp.]
MDVDRRLLTAVDQELAALEQTQVEDAAADPRVRLLLTLPGIDVAVATALLAAIGIRAGFRPRRGWPPNGPGSLGASVRPPLLHRPHHQTGPAMCAGCCPGGSTPRPPPRPARRLTLVVKSGRHESQSHAADC